MAWIFKKKRSSKIEGPSADQATPSSPVSPASPDQASSSLSSASPAQAPSSSLATPSDQSSSQARAHAPRRTRAAWVSGAALAFVALFYQNCSPVHMTDSQSVESSKSQADNGGPYSGMAKLYQFYNSVTPCPSKDLKGNPLPNTELLFKADATDNNAPFVTRETCADLGTPTPVAETDLKVNPDQPSSLEYKNTKLQAKTVFGDFDVVAAKCPIGKTEIAGAMRTNRFDYGMDWTRLADNLGRGWFIFEGSSTRLYSTIESMPAYMIERTDNRYLDQYRRATQYVNLKPSTSYAFSFVAQPGSVRSADVNIYRGLTATPSPSDETLLLSFNFQTLTVKTQYSANIPGVTATIERFGSAYLCTVYFTTTASTTTKPMDIGVSSGSNGQDFGRLGDSVIATAAQLVEVNEFCK